MARVSRRPTGALAVELKHPLKLWQREVLSPASVDQARLLLVDVAAERARAGAAELTSDAGHRSPAAQGWNAAVCRAMALRRRRGGGRGRSMPHCVGARARL